MEAQKNHGADQPSTVEPLQFREHQESPTIGGHFGDSEDKVLALSGSYAEAE